MAILGAFESLWMGEGGGRMDQQHPGVAGLAEESDPFNPNSMDAVLLAAGQREEGCSKSSVQSKMAESIGADQNH